MNKLEILGYIWIFISMSLSMGLYKLEIRNHPIDKKHEYIKEHRIFGSLTKYLSIISILLSWLSSGRICNAILQFIKIKNLLTI